MTRLANLVKKLLNLLELLIGEIARINVLHFTSEVGELRRISGWREGQWSDFDGH